MSKYPNLITSLIALSGQENVIVVYRAFVDFTGTLEAAMMLSQLLYWTPRSSGWIAKSDQEFSDELCLSSYTTRKARNQLETMDILTTTIRKFAGRPVVHYRLDLKELNHKWTLWIRKVDSANSQSGLCENAKTLTETTTETTIENTIKHSARAENKNPSPTDEKTEQWIQDLENKSTPSPASARTAETYKEELIATETRMLARAKETPWATWGKHSKEAQAQLARRDGMAQSLRRLGYELDTMLGLRPLWKQKRSVASWFVGLANCLAEAEGDVNLVLEAANHLRQQEMTISSPHSLVKTTGALTAKRRSGNRSTITIGL